MQQNLLAQQTEKLNSLEKKDLFAYQGWSLIKRPAALRYLSRAKQFARARLFQKSR